MKQLLINEHTVINDDEIDPTGFNCIELDPGNDEIDFDLIDNPVFVSVVDYNPAFRP